MRRLGLLFTVISGLVLMSTGAFAQRVTGIGVRATPDGAGFNLKTGLSKHLAFEGQLNAGGILGLEGESFNAVGLLEFQIPLPDNSWQIFFGGGIHGGVWDRAVWERYSDGRIFTNRAEPIFGFDGIGGVSYSFKKTPLGLSADIKPAVNVFSSGPDFFPHNMFGLTARYEF